MSWLVYTRGTIQPHRLDVALRAVHQFGAKLNGVKFEKVLSINEGGKLWFAWDEKEIRSVGENILKKCARPKTQKEHFQKMDLFVKRALAAADKIKSFDLKTVSNQKIINLYDYWYKEIVFAHALIDVDVDAIDVVFEDFFQKKLKAEMPKISENEFIELYKNISVPAYESFISQEQRGAMEIAVRGKEMEKDMDRLYNKFWWTKLGWESMTPHSKEYFAALVKKYRKNKNSASLLKSAEQRNKRVEDKRRELLKKYRFSEEIGYWLEVFDRYAYYHDLRKEMQVRTVYAGYLLMAEAARRLKVSKDDLEWLTHQEVQEILRGGKIDEEEIARRKEAVLELVTKKGIKIWSGKAALEKHQKEIPEKIENVFEFKGMGISRGIVRAKVKVCSGAEEALKKIKKGDILVCGMTLPDYVLAMKRAGAIITDEGGITCHAAIISRELGIPCVVGTKVATRVLKDGDLVEVDAEKGVVKILDRK